MKDFLATPESFLPLSLAATASQAVFMSAWHFFVLAVPPSGLPSSLRALVSQPVGARAKATAKISGRIASSVPYSLAKVLKQQVPSC